MPIYKLSQVAKKVMLKAENNEQWRDSNEFSSKSMRGGVASHVWQAEPRQWAVPEKEVGWVGCFSHEVIQRSILS